MDFDIELDWGSFEPTDAESSEPETRLVNSYLDAAVVSEAYLVRKSSVDPGDSPNGFPKGAQWGFQQLAKFRCQVIRNLSPDRIFPERFMVAPDDPSEYYDN